MRDSVGHYELRGAIGQGAMGAVYRAWDPRAEREVAVKVLLGTGESQRKRFRREAEALAGLRHPNIVSVQTTGETGRGHPFIVMDLIQGAGLDAVLERDGPLPIPRAVEIAWHLAQGLAHAHARGILHRDLKPANVLLSESGRPLLTDFGLAKELDATSRTQLTKSGFALGSPGFWPPEQARGDVQAIGPASDVYGLGALLYALLTGAPPIDGATMLEIYSATLDRPPTPPSALRPEVDAALDALVLRCLEKDPAARYGSMLELADALDERLLGADGRPRFGLRLLWLGVVLLAVAAGAAASLQRSPEPEPAPTSSPRLRSASATPTPHKEEAAAPRLWRLAPGGELRYRLIRVMVRSGPPRQSGRIELTIRQRLTRSASDGEEHELTFERFTMTNTQDGVPVISYDSRGSNPLYRELHAQVTSRLLVARPTLSLDPESGLARSIRGVPTLRPRLAGSDPDHPASQMITGVIGVVSDRGLLGWLQTVWRVLPPTADAERWSIRSDVWTANNVPYALQRDFRRRDSGISFRGAAEADAARIPPSLHRNYTVSGLKARGRVRFSPRGLEASRHELEYAILVGSYAGPRRTVLEFARLD